MVFDASATPLAIDAKDITVRFGSTIALDHAGLKVRAGEVHGLMGRNGAGKSTMVSVISGLYEAESGSIQFGNSPAPRAGHVAAWRKYIGTVYQKPMIADELSVLENLFLGTPICSKSGFINRSAMRGRAIDALTDWGIEFDLNVAAGKLSIGQRQLLEIVRIMLLGPKVIVLDEPTAKVGRAEASVLIEHINRLRSRGISFVYVSHHLDEVLAICDTITVLRNGRNIWTRPAKELSVAELSAAMSGAQVNSAGVIGRVLDAKNSENLASEKPALSVRDLTTDAVKEVTFELRRGECVGLAGLRGSGNQDVGRALAGLAAVTAGEIAVQQRPVKPSDVRAMLNAGIGYVSSDRHFDGFVPDMSITDNITMAVLPKLGRYGLVSGRKRDTMVEHLTRRLGVVASSPTQTVARLSGGNQQKVVLGRAVASDPKILLLDNPTAGVDVASRESLFAAVASACNEGATALIISDDEEELKRCGRILVMIKGRISKELPASCGDSEIVAAMSEGE